MRVCAKLPAKNAVIDLGNETAFLCKGCAEFNCLLLGRNEIPGGCIKTTCPGSGKQKAEWIELDFKETMKAFKEWREMQDD